jgi:hypothetical protein
VDAAALLADPLGRKLRVHDAGTGGHPLHVAGADVSPMARRVLVLPVTLEEVGDRLEAAVRMVRRSDRLARAVLDRTHLVEEEEGVDLHQTWRGEGTANDEAAALLLGVGLENAADGTGGGHGVFLDPSLHPSSARRNPQCRGTDRSPRSNGAVAQ